MKHLMKKAVKAAVFAALTTLALTAFASAEGEMAIGAGCTTGTSLRMRSEPNTSSAIVTTLNKSVAVALLDDSVPGWYKINYNGSTGYVSSDYLIIDQDNIFTTYGRVPEGTVNVRAAATTESESLATIDAGTVVTVNGLVNGWYDVTCQCPQRSAGTDQQCHQRQGLLHRGNGSEPSGHPLCVRRRLRRRLRLLRLHHVHL